MSDIRDHPAAAPVSPPLLPGFVREPGAVPLYGLDYQRRPVELYRQMRREHGSVVPILLDGGVPAWYVIGYRELHQVQTDSELFARNPARWNAWDRIPPDWPLAALIAPQPTVAFTEGDEHKRRAGAISDALGGVDLFELRADCERIADGLIDRFAGSGTADLIADYAVLMPTVVTAKLLDVPDEQVDALMRDTAVMVDFSADSHAALQRVLAAMAGLLAAKRQRPGPDVTSRLVQHPAGLTDEEAIADLMALTATGHQPTSCWIGNTLRLMLTDDRFAVKMSGGRSSVGEALNEVLWEDTPLQNFIGRFATRATQLGGRHIQPGDLLVLGLAAANADPQVRPDAGAGIVGNHAHMSFNNGEHRCPHPAPEIAELVTRTAVEVLLDRLPDIDLAVPADSLQWRDSFWVRALRSLPVQFTPGHITGAWRSGARG